MKVRYAAVAAVLVLSGCGGSADGASSGTNNATSKPPAEMSATSDPETPVASDSTFKDGVLTTPDMKIEITSHKVIPVGQKGNEYGSKPVIAFWYKITNISGKELDPLGWILVMNAFQDNNPNAVNHLEVAGAPDERYLDTQMEKIKKGGTVEGAVAYDLDDTTTPVDLVASSDLGTTEIGKVTYELT